jgi:mRNA interferase HigB
MVTCYHFGMQVIARRTLREFWARYPRAEGPIRAWVAIAVKARWAKSGRDKATVWERGRLRRRQSGHLDLGGNKYRLVVHVSFSFGRLLVKFIGTHAEYDRIDPKTVSWRKK